MCEVAVLALNSHHRSVCNLPWRMIDKVTSFLSQKRNMQVFTFSVHWRFGKHPAATRTQESRTKIKAYTDNCRGHQLFLVGDTFIGHFSTHGVYQFPDENHSSLIISSLLVANNTTNSEKYTSRLIADMFSQSPRRYTSLDSNLSSFERIT